MKRALLLIASLFLLACTPDESQFKSDVPTSRPSLEERAAKTIVTKPDAATKPTDSVSLPDSINLDVPFYSQAPDADWSLPWQEACEEASIALAYHTFSDQSLSKEQFKKDVLGMVDWQTEHFGNYTSTTVGQTTQLLEGYYNFTDYRILENPGIEDLKRELAAGHPIVAPFAGRMLKNPFYSGEGPYYHMMVLKGYDSENFITSDVGTKRGENFIYPYATIMNALHDYHLSNIQSTPGRVIVFY